MIHLLRPTRLRSHRHLVALVVGLPLGACASAPDAMVDGTTEHSEATTPDVGVTEIERPDVVPGVGESAEPVAEAAPEQLTIREDGRPSWWFSDERHEGAALTLCAEALGPDMRGARSGAILAARSRARRVLGFSEDDELLGLEIRRTWVWPLPNAAAGSANRYAGYVLISVSNPR